LPSLLLLDFFANAAFHEIVARDGDVLQV